MKNYFHFIFAAALLLGSLILLNSQKSDSFKQLNEHAQIDHLELQAELPSKGAAESLNRSNRINANMVYTCITENVRHLDTKKDMDQFVCMKRQMQIHLELKPRLAMHSGPLILHRPNNEDPPLFCI